MLASTVQFSSNDQPPITPPKQDEFTGAGVEGSLSAVPSDTQQRAQYPEFIRFAFHAPRSSTRVPAEPPGTE